MRPGDGFASICEIEGVCQYSIQFPHASIDKLKILQLLVKQRGSYKKTAAWKFQGADQLRIRQRSLGACTAYKKIRHSCEWRIFFGPENFIFSSKVRQRRS
ncbi:MAG: hypothetical protein ABI476_08125, partial [Oxalobacteraceae bacterium]